MLDGLTADEAVLVEEPPVFPVELLEGVVGEHCGRRLLCDLEDERVAAPHHPGRRHQQFARLDGGLELVFLKGFDSVSKRRVDDHGHRAEATLGEDGANRLVELFQARKTSPFRGDIRSVDHEVSWR
ncbi:MAG: hypothetical protein O3C27_13415 [Actinomycetota bacterium]|nr:hypothetical protein [Actinomycetota bacterium]